MEAVKGELPSRPLKADEFGRVDLAR